LKTQCTYEYYHSDTSLATCTSDTC